ncbi:MAG: VCBS repeat-containing protein [Elusimicrobia bacterium]|nr:VCBS repeat-containing protein [Elusimicrobiota bacterium]
MKNLILVVAFSVNAWAADGTVVRVDGPSVYLDLGAGAAAPGRRFEVLKAGAELKHPSTGESLGPVWERQGSGALTSVEEKYSVGSLSEGKAEVGWKARLLDAASAAPVPAPSANTPSVSPAPGAELSRLPAVKSPSFAMEALDLAVGDVDGDGAPDAVLFDDNKVEVRRMSGDWGVLCSYDEKATSARLLSGEARDLDGDGKAEVFVSIHNRLASAVETHVLDCKGGALVRRETLPWLVRAYGASDGTRPLGAQSLEPDSNFPSSDVHRLAYESGKYRLQKPPLKHKRLEWLYGFAFSPAEGEPILLHYNRAQRLTLRYAKGTWTSPAAYGYGPAKLAWHGTEFHFHPRFMTELAGGELKAVYTVRNIPKLLGMAASFGLYSGAELHRLSFNGMSLEPGWKADLAGSAGGLDLLPSSGGAPERLAVAVVGANGRTAVWLFDK